MASAAVRNQELINDEIMKLVPGASEWDVSNLIALRLEKGSKFEISDFYQPGHIAHQAAEVYAIHYAGDFCFMLDMKQVAKRGRLRNTMTAGIINCFYNDVRGIQIRSERTTRLRERDAAFEDAVLDEGEREPASAAAVEDGYYTFSFDDGTHLTVRVRVKKDDPATQKVAALTGPDNESDYQPFGFLKGTRYVPFSAFRQGYDRWHFVARAMVSLTDEQKKAAGLLYAQKSGRCSICGRVLTHPDSIRIGIGPECMKRGA